VTQTLAQHSYKTIVFFGLLVSVIENMLFDEYKITPVLWHKDY